MPLGKVKKMDWNFVYFLLKINSRVREGAITWGQFKVMIESKNNRQFSYFAL